jgi:hypothetical protein
MMSAQNVLVGERLVGPHILTHRLIDNDYRDNLSYDLPELMENVPLAVRAPMWCMRDGAPARSSALCEVFSVTPITTDRKVEDSLHGPALAGLQSSAFLPVGTPEHPCVCSSC